MQLDADKRRAQQPGEDQPKDGGAFFPAGLRGSNGQRHGERADNQDGGVGGAVDYLQVVAALDEGRQMQQAIDDVGGEHAAEKQDFGDQKSPHAEFSGIALLLDVLVLMGESGRMRSVSG